MGLFVMIGAVIVVCTAEVIYFLRKKAVLEHIPARMGVSLVIPVLFWIYECVAAYIVPDADLRPMENMILVFIFYPAVLFPIWLVSAPLFLFRGISWKCFLFQILLFGALWAVPIWIK